ncbi:MAG TPA: FAD-binding oxidoreductase [Solirubrobacteraceae bacterium]
MRRDVDEQQVGRREFLAAAGAAGASLALAACGTSGDATTHASALIEAAKKKAKAPTPKLPGPGSIKALQRAMKGHVFTRSTPGFASASHVYNERFDGVKPLVVARPVSAADVAAGVNWAVHNGVSLRARSGGHSYAGYSTLSNGLVLDLRRLNGISVNKHAKTATIGAGAQLIDVYNGLAKQGAALPGGSCPSVGISGVTLGGGMGLAGRAFGLTADNLIGATIVTADGKIRTVDAHHNPDLLWALKGGGGGNFGVVTQFTFKVHAMPQSATDFFVTFPWSEASDAIAAWQSWAPHAPDALTSIFHLNGPGSSAAVQVSGQYLGPQSKVGSFLGPLKAVRGAQVTTGQHDWVTLQMLWAGCLTKTLPECHTIGAAPGGTLARASFQAKSDYVTKALPAAGRAALVSAVEKRQSQPGSGAILFDSYGGAINRVKPGATAFVHRNALFCIQYLSYNGGAAWLQQTHGAMAKYVSGQAYQNYIDPNLKGWQKAYYGSNYARLQKIRKQVDPHHHFTFPQAIGR